LLYWTGFLQTNLHNVRIKRVSVLSSYFLLQISTVHSPRILALVLKIIFTSNYLNVVAPYHLPKVFSETAAGVLILEFVF